ncbi:MAG: imidazole glycerol phosphate synthase subunit HisF [Chloroflexi bacterium]|mgnify:CR=1 FL=1|nr:imidazole glycerol phosphate synthase subunit HisF [Chloroflexota bacterium]|tara:strand:+ start:18723 stop:19568 length:846 start_codon:yes stop_codon:yes gene_type:complete
MSFRLIPRLDIKGPNLVKGIHLEGLRVLGKPEQFAQYYYEHGADELLYMDVVASLYQRNNLKEIISRTANNIFIPLTVGGGIRTLDDIATILRSGADKVAINTAAVHRPEFITEASRIFGSSTIIISIEAIKHSNNRYEAYTDNGRESTGLDVFDWAKTATELGCGELLITSIDQDGTGNGFDIELTRRIAEEVPIPVIACGGAGKADHISQAMIDGNADAVCIGSLLHYNYLDHNYDNQDFADEGNIEYLKSARQFSKIDRTTLPEINRFLHDAGFERRT